jgi:hypothetical protein
VDFAGDAAIKGNVVAITPENGVVVVAPPAAAPTEEPEGCPLEFTWILAEADDARVLVGLTIIGAEEVRLGIIEAEGAILAIIGGEVRLAIIGGEEVRLAKTGAGNADCDNTVDDVLDAGGFIDGNVDKGGLLFGSFGTAGTIPTTFPELFEAAPLVEFDRRMPRRPLDGFEGGGEEVDGERVWDADNETELDVTTG